LQRRRVSQHAYDRRFWIQALDAVAARPKSAGSAAASAPGEVPQFPAVFCIDAREESFRGHFEEISP
jgi:hypothetical protein